MTTLVKTQQSSKRLAAIEVVLDDFERLRISSELGHGGPAAAALLAVAVRIEELRRTIESQENDMATPGSF